MCELTVRRGDLVRRISFEAGARLSDLLRSAGIFFPSPCGGRGVCGKCAVVLKGAVSPPTEAEVRAGTRLACQAVLLGDAEAVLPPARDIRQIELGDSGRLPVPSPMEGRYGAAADVGTTTVALRLYDLQSGRALAACGTANPQASVAADVVGRIGAAMTGRAEQLEAGILETLEALLEEACGQAGVDPSLVGSMTVTGNTAMLYLLTGRDPSSLSRAPFLADHLFGETVTLLGRTVWLPRCMHAFVGADISCAVLASGLRETDGTALLADIGTNGELVLKKDGRLYVTSTAAGPAFEGAGISCGCGSVRGAVDRVRVRDEKILVRTIGGDAPIGLCGSGLVDAVRAGLALGAIDETGALTDGPFEIAPGVSLKAADIRAVQMAKAAVAAGIGTLLETAGVSEKDVETFCIAGGFGSRLDAESAAAIGLFPASLVPKARILGNAALTGAALLLTDTQARETVRETAESAVHVDLGGNHRFSERYVEGMFFPSGE